MGGSLFYMAVLYTKCVLGPTPDFIREGGEGDKSSHATQKLVKSACVLNNMITLINKKNEKISKISI